VSLPKKEHVILADNQTKAQSHFQSLTKKFATNAAFRTMYENKMLDYILQHQVEVAPLGPSEVSEFYLPHHAVKKEKTLCRKMGIVFDASSHEPGSPSLNNLLEMGPTSFRISSVSSFDSDYTHVVESSSLVQNITRFRDTLLFITVFT